MFPCRGVLAYDLRWFEFQRVSREPTEPCASLICVENQAKVRKLYPLGHVVLVPSCTPLFPYRLHLGPCNAALGQPRAGPPRARPFCRRCKKRDRLDCQQGQLIHCCKHLFTFPLSAFWGWQKTTPYPPTLANKKIQNGRQHSHK